MVARHHGAPIELQALVRAVPVAADGIAWLDLADALAAHGLEVLVVVLDEQALRATLAADLPVVVSVVDGQAKHALVVTGYDGEGYDVLDPANPHERRLTAIELRRRWARGQAIVTLPRGAGGSGAAGLPLARWRAQDRHYRALEWGLRAERQPAPEGRLQLYQRALAADDEIAELHNNAALALVDLDRRERACEHLKRAATLKPAWPVPAANARALGCPAGP